MTKANSWASTLRLVPLLGEPCRDVSVVECHAASLPAGSARVSVAPGDGLDSQEVDPESQQEKRVPMAVRRYKHRFRLVVVSQDLLVPCYY